MTGRGAEMFREYVNLLIQETMLFNTLTALELKKRRHILGVQGRELNRLTVKTEFYLDEIEKLVSERIKLTAEYFKLKNIDKKPETITLSQLVQLSGSETEVDKKAENFQDISENYRVAAACLKEESEENSRLLRVSEKSVMGVIDGLKNIVSKSDTRYFPRMDKKTFSKSSDAILLNANA